MAEFGARSSVAERMGRRGRGRAALVGAALLLITAFATIPCATASAAAPRSERNFEILRQMEAASNDSDCRTVLKLGLPLVDSKGGTGLTSEYEAYAFDLVVGCEAEAKATESAYRHAFKATALDDSSDYLWRVRLSV